jgi:hypothetical protein
MLRIYESIGFRYIDRYPECSDPEEVADYFIYMQYDFQPVLSGPGAREL